MTKLNLGITLIIMSVITLFVFCWWGTKNYEGGYAIGIFISFLASFITGCVFTYESVK